jgi:hypothetical protein
MAKQLILEQIALAHENLSQPSGEPQDICPEMRIWWGRIQNKPIREL